MKKLPLVAAALVLLGVLGWFLQSPAPQAPRSAGTPEDPPAAVDPAAGTPLELQDLSATSAGSESARALASEAASTTTAARAATGAVQELFGTIVVVDSSGREHAEEDGQLEVVWFVPESAGYELQRQSIPVSKGRFRAPAGVLPAKDGVAARLMLSSAVLGEIPVLAERSQAIWDMEGVPWQPDRSLELRLRWALEIWIEAQDRATKLRLPSISLVRGEALDPSGMLIRGSMCTIPGAVEGQRRTYPSPYRILPNASSTSALQRWYVGAPGYAWSMIDLDYGVGCHAVVELDPGADLTLQVLGESIPTGSLVVTGADNQRFIGDLPSVPCRLHFDGLLPGKLSASVRGPGEFGQGPAIGKVTGELVAGQTTELELTLEAPRKTQPVSVEGVLLVPAAWGLSDCVLQCRRAAEPGTVRYAEFVPTALEPVPGAEGRYAFRIGPVEVGRLEIALSACGYRTGVDVPPGGLFGLMLEVPPPCQVVIRARDQADGQALSLSHLSWLWRDGTTGYSGGQQAQSKNGGESIEFTCPTGQLYLSASVPSYQRFSGEREVVAGLNQVDLEFSRECGVRLSATLNGEDYPLQVDLSTMGAYDLEPLDGAGARLSIGFGDGSIRMTASEPGRYRIRCPHPPQFEAFEDPIVEIPEGEVISLTLDLRRL